MSKASAAKGDRADDKLELPPSSSPTALEGGRRSGLEQEEAASASREAAGGGARAGAVCVCVCDGADDGDSVSRRACECVHVEEGESEGESEGPDRMVESCGGSCSVSSPERAMPDCCTIDGSVQQVVVGGMSESVCEAATEVAVAAEERAEDVTSARDGVEECGESCSIGSPKQAMPVCGAVDNAAQQTIGGISGRGSSAGEVAVPDADLSDPCSTASGYVTTRADEQAACDEQHALREAGVPAEPPRSGDAEVGEASA